MLFSDDMFAVTIDPFADGRSGYFFEINPAGLMHDGLLNVLGQFDNASNTVGLQVRFRWIVRPGSELFVGYLHDWAEQTDPLAGRRRWRTLDREAALKGFYTWRF